MAIQATQSAQTANSQTTTAATGRKSDVNKEDFLKLLISQLQNQDPLKPQDNQEFAQQLATFNSLEQLIGVNQKLSSLADKLLQSNQFNATNLLGKQVVTDGNQISLKQGQSTPINFNLGANAAKVTIDIKNSKGEIVRRIEKLDQKAGDQRVDWDGKTNSGASAAAGTYSFDIRGVDVANKTVTATGRILGTVAGVSLDGADPMLDIGGVQVPLSSITTVRQ